MFGNLYEVVNTSPYKSSWWSDWGLLGRYKNTRINSNTPTPIEHYANIGYLIPEDNDASKIYIIGYSSVSDLLQESHDNWDLAKSTLVNSYTSEDMSVHSELDAVFFLVHDYYIHAINREHVQLVNSPPISISKKAISRLIIDLRRH